MKPNPLFNYFDASRVINLDSETIKLEKFQNHIESYSICNVERFSAIERERRGEAHQNTPYNPGAGLSHQGCVREAKLNQQNHVLVFEDDCEFTGYDEYLLKSNIDYVSDNYWEYYCLSHIYMGDENSFMDEIRKGSIKRVTPSLIEFNKVPLNSACCVAYNHTIFDKFLNEFDPEKVGGVCIDKWSSLNFKTLAAYPCAGLQNDKKWQVWRMKSFNNLVEKHLPWNGQEKA